MDCSKLTKGLIAAICNKNAVAGAEDDCIILDFNDVDRVKSVIEDNVISSIVMKKDLIGFAFTTVGRSYNDAGHTFAKGTYRNTISHSVPLRIFMKTEESKKFVNQFVSGAKVIVILKNKEQGVKGEVKYESYGWDNGLELSELSDTIAMADGIVYNLNLSSSDDAQEGSLPKSVFDTDLDTTELMIKALTAVA